MSHYSRALDVEARKLCDTRIANMEPADEICFAGQENFRLECARELACGTGD